MTQIVDNKFFSIQLKRLFFGVLSESVYFSMTPSAGVITILKGDRQI